MYSIPFFKSLNFFCSSKATSDIPPCKCLQNSQPRIELLYFGLPQHSMYLLHVTSQCTPVCHMYLSLMLDRVPDMQGCNLVSKVRGAVPWPQKVLCNYLLYIRLIYSSSMDHIPTLCSSLLLGAVQNYVIVQFSRSIVLGGVRQEFLKTIFEWYNLKMT